MRMFLRCLLLTTFGTVGLAAQDKPDFSGTWVLQDARQRGVDIPGTLAIRQLLQRTTASGEPMLPAFVELRVERHFESGVRADTYHLGTVGGTVSGIPGDGSDPPINRGWSRESVRWEGDRLHIDTEHYSGPTRDSGPYTEHTEVWWLDEQGQLLIMVADRRSDSEVDRRTLTYRRQ
jgi:hypothetical protein